MSYLCPDDYGIVTAKNTTSSSIEQIFTLICYDTVGCYLIGDQYKSKNGNYFIFYENCVIGWWRKYCIYNMLIVIKKLSIAILKNNNKKNVII